MVDYSKWDHIDVSDDEEEVNTGPRITRLDEGSSVTWGGNTDGSVHIAQPTPSPAPQPAPKSDPPHSLEASGPPTTEKGGEGLSSQYSKWDKIAADMSDGEEEEGEEGSEDDDAEYLPDSDEEEEVGASSQAPRAVEDKGINFEDPALHRNGGVVGDRYVWSQSRLEVIVHIALPPGTKGKDISVRATKWSIEAKAHGKVVLEGRLAYPITVEGDTGTAASEDHSIEAELDWEIKDMSGPPPCRRVLVITLPKRSPAPGVVVWWQGVITGDPTVAIEDMPDRETAAQTVMQQNWAEAHRMFREKMAQRKQIPVDIPDDSGEGDVPASME